MQPEADLPAMSMTTPPMITISINNGSLQVDDIELDNLADRLRVNRSAEPGQRKVQLG